MQRPRILAVSSFVARGSVGLRAIAPALSALGCEAMLVPTVVLSNHPRHPQCCGEALAPGLTAGLFEALAGNGWFAGLDCVLSGYVASAGQVEAIAQAVRTARASAPDLLYVLDPVLGDDPQGLYVGADVAEGMRAELVALAGVATPNRFELAHLTGLSVSGVDDAVRAARSLGVSAVVATSIPAGPGTLATVLVTPDQIHVAALARQPGLPHGTGDLLAALLTGHLARGRALPDAFSEAHATLAAVIAVSVSGDLLDLSPLTRCTG